MLNRRQKRLYSSEGLINNGADEMKDPVVGKKVVRPLSSRKMAAYEEFTSKKKKREKNVKKIIEKTLQLINKPFKHYDSE